MLVRGISTKLSPVAAVGLDAGGAGAGLGAGAAAAGGAAAV